MSFTAWRTTVQEFVRVSPLTLKTMAVTAPELAPPDRASVIEHLRLNPSQLRECYQNAQKLCAAVSSVNYVLGRVTVPGYGTIDHAWNSDKYGHFDITFANREDFHECNYQAIVTLTADQVVTMTWMGLPPTIYDVFQMLQSESH